MGPGGLGCPWTGATRLPRETLSPAVFIFVNLRPAICLCQEAGAKHVGGWVGLERSKPKALLRLGWATSCRALGVTGKFVASCPELPGRAVTGTIRKAPARRPGGGPGTGGGEGGQQKDGMGKGRVGRRVKPNFYSRHRAQGCIPKGGQWQSREAWAPATALSLPVAGKLGGWKLTQGLGFRMGSPQTLKRECGEETGHHAAPPTAMPVADITNQVLMMSDRHHQSRSRRPPGPLTPGQSSDPLNSPRQSLLIHWGGGILQYSCQHWSRM